MTTMKRGSALRLAGSALWVAAWPALMIVLAGDARWIEGWLFAGWLLGLYAAVTIWMHFNNPELLAERRRHATTQRTEREPASDRGLVLLIFLGFTVWIVLMPLDAKRYGWTPPFSLPLQTSGGLLLGLSAFFLFRAFRDNTFLSGVVRVQSERKQHVVSTGVYAFVRHPMYLGMLLMFTGAPLLVGSQLGLAVAVPVTIILSVRINREEQLLVHELDGYEEYRRRVRYRLVPLIW